MIPIGSDGMKFFELELLNETNEQLRIFERKKIPNELGRIKLYEERMRIKSYFRRCDNNKSYLLENEENHAILSKLKELNFPASLKWVEEGGIRYNLKDENHPDLAWEDSPPNVLLTKDGKVRKRLI
jgi:hypothetical protein